MYIWIWHIDLALPVAQISKHNNNLDTCVWDIALCDNGYMKLYPYYIEKINKACHNVLLNFPKHLYCIGTVLKIKICIPSKLDEQKSKRGHRTSTQIHSKR